MSSSSSHFYLPSVPSGVGPCGPKGPSRTPPRFEAFWTFIACLVQRSLPLPQVADFRWDMLACLLPRSRFLRREMTKTKNVCSAGISNHRTRVNGDILAHHSQLHDQVAVVWCYSLALQQSLVWCGRKQMRSVWPPPSVFMYEIAQKL